MSLIMKTPNEFQIQLAFRLREARLVQGLRQKTVAERAGVPLPTLRRFEKTGEVPLSSFVRIAVAIGFAQELDSLFEPRQEIPAHMTLDEVMRTDQRRAIKRLRGRK